jgi:hypothetical protein
VPFHASASDTALALLTEHWRCVEALAIALIEHRRIEGEEVERIAAAFPRVPRGAEQRASTTRPSWRTRRTAQLRFLHWLTAHAILIAAINAIVDCVDIGVLAAAEVASALHQIVRPGRKPCPEAVEAKRLRWRHVIVDEIGSRD